MEHFYKAHLGQTVHYHDGFGQFVRCEVIQSEGDFYLRRVALVGAWKDYDLMPTSYRVRSIVENQLMRPHISNIYEASLSLQNRLANPADLAPIVIKGQRELFAS